MSCCHGILTVFSFHFFTSRSHRRCHHPTPPYVGLTQGLVGAWSFDGNTMGTTSVYDASGNGNTGWLTNGPKKVVGKIGQGIEFVAV